MRIFTIALVTEFFSFFILVCNTRAVAQGSYMWTAITDTLFTAQSFFVARWMIETKEARGMGAFMGFMLGGTLGSLAAIFTTKHLYGRV